MMTALLLAAAIAGLDAWPDKARFAPNEPIHVIVERPNTLPADTTAEAVVEDLGRRVGGCDRAPLASRRTALACHVPPIDFRGYRVAIIYRRGDGSVVATGSTALDVSSDWSRYPRYGYVARYAEMPDALADEWIDDLARYHVNGIQFYDFQDRHERPLAGSVAAPEAEWKDIAARPVRASVIRRLIADAHRANMTTMAYNASYSAYADALAGRSALPLAWATWRTSSGPRTAKTVKTFDLNVAGWETPHLLYMNQNDPGWRAYLFDRMRDLFAVYPFDGWHVDTFGETGGFAFDGARIDYPAGFPSFIDEARRTLDRRIVFNAVNTVGQTGIARSTADIVYSELWSEHETYGSILAAAEEVHLANPAKAVVFAAYVHRRNEATDGPPPKAVFNPTSVLLLDAAITAAGASHIELGDGGRMLSSEYFPNDEKIGLNRELAVRLRHYYDFATANEAYLYRGTYRPLDLHLAQVRSSTLGLPGTVWTVVRRTGDATVVHLINLLSSRDGRWRDVDMTAAPPRTLTKVLMTIPQCRADMHALWATPDGDGRWRPLAVTLKAGGCSITLPSLDLWTVVMLG